MWTPVGTWAPRTAEPVVACIRAWVPAHTVAEIAARLNEAGCPIAWGQAFRDYHILYITRRHHILVTTCVWRLPAPRTNPAEQQAIG